MYIYIYIYIDRERRRRHPKRGRKYRLYRVYGLFRVPLLHPSPKTATHIHSPLNPLNFGPFTVIHP